MVFTKTLNFNYENLGKEGYLIFTFDDPNIAGHELYKDCFPVVWRVAHLQAEGAGQFSETYEQQFCFATSQVRQGQVITPGVAIRIDFKESTNLTGDEHTGYQWSVPEKISAPNNVFEAHNLTSKKQHFAAGLFQYSAPEPILYFDDVEPQATLKVEFKGQLRIYAVTDIQKGAVIRSEVISPPLWDHSLYEEDLPENWIVTFSGITGNFEIHPSE